MTKFLILIFFVISFFQVTAQPIDIVVQSGHTGWVNAITLSTDKQYLASSGYDLKLKLWSMETGREIRTFGNYDTKTSEACLAFSPNGEYLLSASENGQIKLWEVFSGKLIRTYTNTKGINCIIFYKDGSKFVTGDKDGYVTFWDVYEDKQLKTIKADQFAIHRLGFWKDNLIWIGRLTNLTFWNIQDEKIVFEHKTHVRGHSFYFDIHQDVIAFWAGVAKLTLMDLTTKKILKTIPFPSQAGSNLKWAKDGEYIVAATNKHIGHGKLALEIKGVDLRTTKREILIEERLCGAQVLAMIGNNFVFAKENKLQYYSLEEDKLIPFFKQNVTSKPIYDLHFQNDGQSFWTNHGDFLQQWGHQNGTVFKLPTKTIKSRFNPKFPFLVIHHGLNDTVSILTDKGLQYATDLPFQFDRIKDFKMSEDGEWLVMIKAKELICFNFLEQKVMYKIPLESPTNTILINTKKEVLLWADKQGNITTWSLKKRKKRLTFNTGLTEITAMTLEGLNKNLLIGTSRGELRLFTPKKGKHIEKDWTKKTEKSYNYIHKLIATETGFLAQQHDGIYEGKNDKTFQKIIPLKSHSSQFDYSKETNALVYYDDQFDDLGHIVYLKDYRNPKAKIDLAWFDYDDWAIYNADNLFDATPKAMEDIHYTIGLETVELEQLKERYYEPNLFQKWLGIMNERVRSVVTLKRVPLFPKVKLSLQEDKNELFLKINLRERGGGIGQTSVFINGKEVIADTRIGQKIKPFKDAVFDIDLLPFQNYFLLNKPNIIAVQTANKAGWLKSRTEFITTDYHPVLVAKGKIKKTKRIKLKGKYEPDFYGIVIGTADYKGEKLDLNYADKDAQDIAKTFGQTAKNFFGKSNVKMQLLTTNSEKLPSKEAIQKAFESIAKEAKAEDVLFIYFSGHGLNYGEGKGMFYYLTKDIETGDLSDKGIRKSYAISTQELTNWINLVPAQKQVLILDACYSGKVVENMIATKRSVMSATQRRALERLKDRTGMFVLAGSASDKVSYEASQFGQGLLTYCLLEGLNGAALRNKEFVDVMQLFQFAADKVPQYAEYIGGVQKPVIASPNGGNSFDIGRTTEQTKIPLVAIKPLFVRSNFQESESYSDVLQLGQKLDLRFIENAAQGKQASMIFIDVNQHPKAYSVRGRYELDKDAIIIQGKVFKGEGLLSPFKIKGSQKNMEITTQMILDAVERIIK